MTAPLHSVLKPLSGTPVLTYHGFNTGDESHAKRRERKYSIDPALFRQQINFLSQEKFETKDLPDFWASRRGAGSHRSVVLSFDDGRSSDYEIAFPTLLDANMTATFFVNTATIGTPGFLSWSQVEEMRRFGMSFQSHSHKHVYLSRIPRQEMQQQLRLSKVSLEEHTGWPVEFLAAPYGDVSRPVVQSASEIGYRALCTSYNWPAQPGRPTLSRIVVYGSTTLDLFRRLVARDPYLYTGRVARQACLYLAKELFFLCRNPARQEQRAA